MQNIKKYSTVIAIVIAAVITGCKKDNSIYTCIVGKWKYIGAESNGNFISVDSTVYDHYTFYENKNKKGTFSYDYISPDTSYVIMTGNYNIDGNNLELIWPYRTNTDKFEIICNDSIMKLGPPVSINYYNILRRN